MGSPISLDSIRSRPSARSTLLGDGTAHLKFVRQNDHIIAFERAGLVFVFNFDPVRSHMDYVIPVSIGRDHEVVFTTDDGCYGGFDNIGHELRLPSSPA